jgi:molybdate transport system substrate-binding protein
MTPVNQRNMIIAASILCGFLLISVFLTGCTSSSTQVQAAATPSVTTIPAPVTATSAPPDVTSPAPVTSSVSPPSTSTPVPVFTFSSGNVVAFTAASLKGVSPKLAADFEKVYPGHHVVFNLDGTQALKTQVENGAYADVFISASNSYTTTLTNEGYFVNGTVKPLTSNYVIVILPAANPANIKTLADLSKPGIKIAMEDKSVPAGTATIAALGNLAKSTYSAGWNKSVFSNVVTYETSEPGVATKVALGEVDAGFVYESTFTSAPKNTYIAITIPKSDNYLQTYTIGTLKGSTNQGTAAMFETFMLSATGQQDLKDYGFRPI